MVENTTLHNCCHLLYLSSSADHAAQFSARHSCPRLRHLNKRALASTRTCTTSLISTDIACTSAGLWKRCVRLAGRPIYLNDVHHGIRCDPLQQAEEPGRHEPLRLCDELLVRIGVLLRQEVHRRSAVHGCQLHARYHVHQMYLVAPAGLCTQLRLVAQAGGWEGIGVWDKS